MIGSLEPRKIGDDLFFHAIVHGNIQDAVALLEDQEVDINCKNINGQTCLHVITYLVCSRKGAFNFHKNFFKIWSQSKFI